MPSMLGCNSQTVNKMFSFIEFFQVFYHRPPNRSSIKSITYPYYNGHYTSDQKRPSAGLSRCCSQGPPLTPIVLSIIRFWASSRGAPDVETEDWFIDANQIISNGGRVVRLRWLNFWLKDVHRDERYLYAILRTFCSGTRWGIKFFDIYVNIRFSGCIKYIKSMLSWHCLDIGQLTVSNYNSLHVPYHAAKYHIPEAES